MGLAAPAPSEARQKALTDYIGDLLRRMNLDRWVVRIIYDEHPDRASEGRVIAEMDPIRGRHLGTLTFGERFWHLPRADMRETIVHELLHLAHANLWFVIDSDPVRSALGPSSAVVLDNLDREIELMTDHLAGIIAPSMPLPPRLPR